MAAIKIVPSKMNEKVFTQIHALHENFKKGVRLGFEQAASSHERQIREDLNDKAAKTGRIYLVRLEGRLVRHQSSAPGQTAATLTGNYGRLVGTETNGSDTMVFGAGAEYARFLEEGTSRMAPRPSLTNTVEKEERNTQTYLGTQVYRALTGKVGRMKR